MKLFFNVDGFVDGKLVFEKGKIYDIESPASAARWIARGATEAEENHLAKVQKVEAPKEDPVVEEIENNLAQHWEEQIIDTEVKVSKNKSRKKSRGVDTPL